MGQKKVTGCISLSYVSLLLTLTAPVNHLGLGFDTKR